MFNFNKTVICDEITPCVKVMVWANMDCGCLKIAGQDLGKAPEDIFVENEYEYFYSFDLGNTSRLYELLAAESTDPNDAFLARFRGINGCKALREYCDANGVKYCVYSIAPGR